MQPLLPEKRGAAADPGCSLLWCPVATPHQQHTNHHCTIDAVTIDAKAEGLSKVHYNRGTGCGGDQQQTKPKKKKVGVECDTHTRYWVW